jgi:hypothetical protein
MPEGGARLGCMYMVLWGASGSRLNLQRTRKTKHQPCDLSRDASTESSFVSRGCCGFDGHGLRDGGERIHIPTWTRHDVSDGAWTRRRKEAYACEGCGNPICELLPVRSRCGWCCAVGCWYPICELLPVRSRCGCAAPPAGGATAWLLFVRSRCGPDPLSLV